MWNSVKFLVYNKDGTLYNGKWDQDAHDIARAQSSETSVISLISSTEYDPKIRVSRSTYLNGKHIREKSWDLFLDPSELEKLL